MRNGTAAFVQLLRMRRLTPVIEQCFTLDDDGRLRETGRYVGLRMLPKMLQARMTWHRN